MTDLSTKMTTTGTMIVTMRTIYIKYARHFIILKESDVEIAVVNIYACL